MKKVTIKPKLNFFTEHKDLFIAGGAIVLLAGAGFTYYYLKKKKELKTEASNEMATASTLTKTSLGKELGISALSADKSAYPIKFGSRSAQVKVLQRYLKFYKENLGSTGTSRDGVDGIFGPKTARAAKKRLGKSVFTKKDIEGMQSALKTLGK